MPTTDGAPITSWPAACRPPRRSEKEPATAGANVAPAALAIRLLYSPGREKAAVWPAAEDSTVNEMVANGTLPVTCGAPTPAARPTPEALRKPAVGLSPGLTVANSGAERELKTSTLGSNAMLKPHVVRSKPPVVATTDTVTTSPAHATYCGR